MPNYNSIEGNVLFPTIDGYDMHKAGDMALYLAHCDFYPFKSVIDNNKIVGILTLGDLAANENVNTQELCNTLENICGDNTKNAE